MKKILTALVVSAALALSACNPIKPTDVATVASSAQGLSVITALTKNFAPGINTAIANISAKVVSSKDAQMVTQALAWAPVALDLFGRFVGLSATDIATLKVAATAAARTLQSPPADLGTAVADAVDVYRAVVYALAPALTP